MGFADGFLKGMAVVNSFQSMVSQQKEKAELDKVAQAKPENSTGYTAQDGASMEALANKGYKIDFDQGANAYVATNEAGDSKSFPMKGVTDFLGERTDELDGAQVRHKRQVAMADVIAKRDPARGMQMQAQLQRNAHAAKQMHRTEGEWAREDSDREATAAIDAQLQQSFNDGLVDADGQPRQATPDDYLGLTQQRALRFAQAGNMGKAGELFKEHAAISHVKIQMETEQRNKALGETMASLAAGDHTPAIGFLNKYVPSGSTFTSAETGKNGELVLHRTGMGGQQLDPLTLTQEQAQNMLLASSDPRQLYQFSQDMFGRQLKIKQDQRASAAESRAVAQHGVTMEKARHEQAQRASLPSVIDALAGEKRFTKAQLDAVNAGIVQKPSLAELAGTSGRGRAGGGGGSGSGAGGYQYDPVQIRKALGKVEVNPYTQKETVSVDPERLAKFEEFVTDNAEITDQDEMLHKFTAWEVQQRRGQKAKDEAEAQRRRQVIENVRKQATPEAIAETAKQRNMSIEEVKEALQARGVL